MKTYKQRIKENFEAIDRILSGIPKDSLLFHQIFSIRSQYAVYPESCRNRGKGWIIRMLLLLCLAFASFCLYCFRKILVTNQDEVVILGDWRFDVSLSKELNIKRLRYKDCFTITRFFGMRWISELYSLIKTVAVLRKLKKTNLAFSLYHLTKYSIYFNTVDLSGIKVLVGANDLSPSYYAIWQKAKEQSIKRVHIEYVQINSMTADSIFADYYYYPSSLHLNIRKKCPYNKDVVYVKGGYLNTDYIQYARQNKIKTQAPEVTYITSHSNLFAKDDLFYISEILQVLPEDYRLNIKIHPFDKQDKYNSFLSDPKVAIFHFKDISNSELIARSKMVFSMVSVLSIEAKTLCNESYYLNYDAYSGIYADYYDELSQYMDVITTRGTLEDVFTGIYKNKSLDLFKANINMSYPNTFDHFKSFTERLKRNEPINNFI